MLSRFTVDELMVRVMPGGVLLASLYVAFGNGLSLMLGVGLDILYTFLFLCGAFIVGELLQVLAHELEFIIDLFFRCRRPSQVFLYRNNPVVRDRYTLERALVKIQLTETEAGTFDKDYSDIGICWGKAGEDDKLSQGIFWRLYSAVSNTDEIRLSNRNYLFARVIMVDFLIISAVFFATNSLCVGSACLAVFLIFLWRSRGIARGLVFKTVLLNSRDSV